MLNLDKFCNLRMEICFGLGVAYLQKHERRKVDNQRNYSGVLTFENMISNNVGYEVIMGI